MAPTIVRSTEPVERQLEKKYYAAETGEIEEQVVQGAHERFQLVGSTRS